uniref:STAS domain-containing protein n=1 Tax=Pyricularia oryzae (strain 70-15 / ATCC MYA-4617 / FGSC 8958) TaxID=242507 RepID=Q2KEM2_PYRO7|nr:hypothetical protein MGCH7_ch7g1014 [Pyricularia oryzae 70-15]
MAKYVDAAKQDLREDVTWQKAGRLSRRGIKEFPEASVQYLLDKAPIIGWLPKYNPRWLINDAIAGLTLGLMLIPQGLAYAKIAEIPVEYGLMSSWLPASIYAIMGTTKDLSTGPTSLIGLLTSEGVHEFGEEYTPSQVASAMALWMGVFGMVLGFLKLGWLLEFISLPILSGFITAVAITIALNQMPSLLGISGVGSGTAQQIHDVFAFLPRASLMTCTFTRVTASGIPAPSDISDRDLPHPDSPQARDVHVFRFNDSFFFPNSYMCSTAILDSIQTYHAPAYHGAQGPEVRERNWSVVAEKRIQRLRRRAGVTDPDALPPIGLVVLDFGRVNHVDSTACSHLKNLAKEISRYGGKHVELRFVGMTEYVRERFDATLLFPTVAAAVLAPRRNDAPEVVQHDFDEKRSSSEDLEKGMAMHAETADRSSSQERKTEARP